MNIRRLHSWDVSVDEAKAIQVRLASQVVRDNRIPDQPRYAAGADISRQDARGVARAAVVVVRLPELEVVEVKCVEGRPGFPYVPGLLSFRESPLALAALERLTLTPDFLLVDGQGLAHPRRFGLACHLGLLADIPAIGCAKSRLLGRHEPLGVPKGAWASLEDASEVVGAALRTRDGVTPIYVSIGHKVDLPSALKWTLACCKGYRVPEPTRLAHLAAAGRLAERALVQPEAEAGRQMETG